LPVFVLFFPPLSTHAGLSPPHKRVFLCLTEKKARGVEMGGKKGTRTEKNNKNCFQFTIDYIQYHDVLKTETLFRAEKTGFTLDFFLHTKFIHNCTKIGKFRE
jgi:hypothetical protein